MKNNTSPADPEGPQTIETNLTATEHVLVDASSVLIAALVETDPDVVRVVGDADDPIEATHNCLQVGAKALRVANTAVDVHVIERSFEALASRLDSQVDNAVERITTTANGLLDGDDGALNSVLLSFRAELEELLGNTFDPDSKASVCSTIEDLVEGVVNHATEGVKRLVQVDGDESPFAQLKTGILSGVKGEIEGVVREIRDVSERLGIAAAVAAEHQRTSGKGFDFEDVVDERVGTIAAAYGDAHEHVAQELGTMASKVGDEIVTLNPDASRGQVARFVLEDKTEKRSLRAIVAEMDEAMINRDALAAIAVFDCQKKAPTRVPFHYFDDKAIVVLDADEDDGPLRLGYMWARWMVQRKLCRDVGEQLDTERVGLLIDDAQRALERLTTIKGFHSSARKSIDKAAEQVGSLVAEVRESLDALEAEFGNSG